MGLCKGRVQTLLDRDKMAEIWHLEMKFPERKCLNLDRDYIQLWSSCGVQLTKSQYCQAMQIANIVITCLSHITKNIPRNETAWYRRSKINVTWLLGDLDTETDVALHFWSVRIKIEMWGMFWVHRFGNQDLVPVSVSMIAGDRKWRPFWMVVNLEDSLYLFPGIGINEI